jgi:hypothetical protein
MECNRRATSPETASESVLASAAAIQPGRSSDVPFSTVYRISTEQKRHDLGGGTGTDRSAQRTQ